MIPFVGPSYQLANRKASIQRAVNLFLNKIEGPEKAQYILDSVPGLVQWGNPASGAIRGLIEISSRAFCRG